jgi:hypothetical protein
MNMIEAGKEPPPPKELSPAIKPGEPEEKPEEKENA